jgi:hypothetical protein
MGRRPDGGGLDPPEDAGIEGSRFEGTECFGAGPDPQEGQMSASTRTVQQPLGTRQMSIALVAAASLAVVLAAALAFSQAATTKSQTAPAVGAAPVFIDHGSRDEIGPGAVFGPASVSGSQARGYLNAAAAAVAAAPALGAPPAVIDHGSRDEMAASGSVSKASGGSNGPRLRPQ